MSNHRAKVENTRQNKELFTFSQRTIAIWLINTQPGAMELPIAPGFTFTYSKTRAFHLQHFTFQAHREAQALQTRTSQQRRQADELLLSPW